MQRLRSLVARLPLLRLLIASIWFCLLFMLLGPLVFPDLWWCVFLPASFAIFKFLFSDGYPWHFLHTVKENTSRSISKQFHSEEVRPWLLRVVMPKGSTPWQTTNAERLERYNKYRREIELFSQRFHALRLPADVIEAYINTYETHIFADPSVFLCLEDYIEETFADDKLMKWLGRMVATEVSRTVLLALHDILFLSALVPVRILKLDSQLHPSFPVLGDYQRFAFAPLSLQLAIKLAKEVTRNAATGLRISLISHVPAEAYAQMPLVQRWLLLSLMNYSPEVRALTLKDSMWKTLMGLAPLDIAIWVGGASGHLEQFFLNTCKTCANNQALLAHMPTTINGIIMAETSPWAGVDAYETNYGVAPNMEAYLRTQIDCYSASLKRLRVKANNLLQRKPISIAQVFELTNDWSYAMQQMSAVWRPGLSLTVKPIADDWAASAKLMTLVAALQVAIPGQPALHLLPRGSPRSWKHMHRLVECSTAFEARKDCITFGNAAWKLRIACHSDVFLDELWRATARLGGVLVGSNDQIAGVAIGHLGFLTAWRAPWGGRCFLLSDPEYTSFKALSYTQMRHFVAHPPHATDFFHVD